MDILKEYFDKCKGARKFTYKRARDFWVKQLFEKCMHMFTYEGLPFDSKELESRLIVHGFCGVVKSTTIVNKKRVKGLMATNGSMSGVTEYYDKFTIFTFANPLESGVRSIGIDCAIVDANKIRLPLMELIEYYAHLLAHATLSLQAVLINARATGILVAKDDKQAESIRAWYNGLEDGKTASIVDDVNFNSLINSQGLRLMNNSFPASTSIRDYYDIMQNLLKDFFASIGVSYANSKRERLISDEVAQDAQPRLVNISDMIAEREKGIAEVNRIFGINATVKLSEEFEILATSQGDEGGNDND